MRRLAAPGPSHAPIISATIAIAAVAVLLVMPSLAREPRQGAALPSLQTIAISLTAAADATLYEDATGSLANGGGEHFFAGRTSLALRRRSVIRFDMEQAFACPAGSTIESAQLRLVMTRGQPGTFAVTLHTVTSAWTEGASNPPGEEGIGAPAVPGDATWIHNRFPTDLWNSAGGDFDTSQLASTSVGGLGTYTWGSTLGMVDDVQQWLDDPDSNFGWLLRGNELQNETARRFASRTNPVIADRPLLVIDCDAIEIPATVTSTITPTVTTTPSATFPPSATPTPSTTMTPSVTPTPSITVTPTPSDTPTVTSTAVATDEPTATASASATDVATATVRPDATATADSTPTADVTPTVDGTPADATATATVEATPTVDPVATPTPDATPTASDETATPTVEATAEVTSTGPATETATATGTITSTATITTTATITATASATATMPVTITPTAVVLLLPIVQRNAGFGPATETPTATLDLPATAPVTTTATAIATDAVTATATAVAKATAVATEPATASATAVATDPVTATATGIATDPVTVTATAIVTTTAIATQPVTATATAIATTTAIATEPATATPLAPPTTTVTPAPTATDAPSATQVPSPTVTATLPPAPSATASVTPLPTATAQPSVTPTSTPLPAPTLTPEPDACARPLLDPGFESGTPWRFGGLRPGRLDDSLQFDGRRSLLVGLTPDEPNFFAYSSAWQPVVVPLDASRLRVSARVRQAADPVGSRGTDRQYLLVYDIEPSQNVVAMVPPLLRVVAEIKDDRRWLLRTRHLDVSQLRGRTLWLYAGVRNDGEGSRAWMNVDAVEMVFCP